MFQLPEQKLTPSRENSATQWDPCTWDAPKRQGPVDHEYTVVGASLNSGTPTCTENADANVKNERRYMTTSQLLLRKDLHALYKWSHSVNESRVPWLWKR